MNPEHANLYGNVHGGVVMKLIDEAGAIAATRHAQRPCVTVAIDSLAFHSPVHVGQLLSCRARITWVGRTSIEVEVTVEAEDLQTGDAVHTNSARVLFVALDDKGHPTEVPSLLLESAEDRERFEQARERQRQRLGRSGRR